MLFGRTRQVENHGAGAPGIASDDARLLTRIGAGDIKAFELLYRLYHTRLSRFLLSMLRRPALVEEVLNDTLMVVWRRPQGYNGQSKVSTWIFAIAYRQALKARARADEPAPDPQVDARPSLELGPEEALGGVQLQAIIAEALATLSPEHRAVVDLTYFHGAGYREIAEILDCPLGTVKTRMLHARRRLKDVLTHRFGEGWW